MEVFSFPGEIQSQNVLDELKELDAIVHEVRYLVVSFATSSNSLHDTVATWSYQVEHLEEFPGKYLDHICLEYIFQIAEHVFGVRSKRNPSLHRHFKRFFISIVITYHFATQHTSSIRHCMPARVNPALSSGRTSTRTIVSGYICVFQNSVAYF